ncbi:hypothetical protein H2248_005661 [Termitomyces sp. 'cryptogamus']|nr:hypothetical protein H2248_005661 [Termitomyces sp. 'cryptogamus']
MAPESQKSFKSSDIPRFQRTQHAYLYHASSCRTQAESSNGQAQSSWQHGSSSEVNMLRGELTGILEEKKVLETELEKLRQTAIELEQVRNEMSEVRESRDHLFRIQQSLAPVVKQLTTCTICQSIVTPPLTSLQCGHYFCKACIDDWEWRFVGPGRAKCPHCRGSIRKVDRSLVGFEDLIAEAQKL